MEIPQAEGLKVICISPWKARRFYFPLFFHLVLQESNQKKIKICIPGNLLIVFDDGCPVCRIVTGLVALSCSRLADDALSSNFSITVDLVELLPSCLSSPLSFPAVLPLLSFWLVWPLRRFFLEVSLIPATGRSSLSVDPLLPSLVCFLVLLTDFFTGLAGINRGDDGHDSMTPASETLETKWEGKKSFVRHLVFKVVDQKQGLGLISKNVDEKL